MAERKRKRKRKPKPKPEMEQLAQSLIAAMASQQDGYNAGLQHLTFLLK